MGPLTTRPSSPASAGGDATDRWPAPLTVALTIPALLATTIWFGYGTDIDIDNVRRSGEAILDGDYELSRTPGSLVTETVTGVLDALGGAWLVNLGSLVAATITLVLLARVVEHEMGRRSAILAVLVVGLHPWFWVAATSLGDLVYVFAFLLGGIRLVQTGRVVVAPVLFACAIGSRMTSVLLIGAYLLAHATAPTDDPDARRARWRRAVGIGLASVALGALFFIPPWLQFDRSLDFLQNQFDTGSLAVLVGRWGVKNLAFFGIPAVVVVAWHWRVVRAALTSWRHSELVRFAVLAAVVTEALYLRFPFKVIHLLPMALVLGLVVAAAPDGRARSRLAILLVAAQVLHAVVSVTVAAPDEPNQTTSAELEPGLVWGVFVNEMRCRIDPPVDGSLPDPFDPDAGPASEVLFDCQARSWRAEP